MLNDILTMLRDGERGQKVKPRGRLRARAFLVSSDADQIGPLSRESVRAA